MIYLIKKDLEKIKVIFFNYCKFNFSGLVKIWFMYFCLGFDFVWYLILLMECVNFLYDYYYVIFIVFMSRI